MVVAEIAVSSSKCSILAGNAVVLAIEEECRVKIKIQNDMALIILEQSAPTPIPSQWLGIGHFWCSIPTLGSSCC
jgi:hypothetical protein